MIKTIVLKKEDFKDKGKWLSILDSLKVDSYQTVDTIEVEMTLNNVWDKLKL